MSSSSRSPALSTFGLHSFVSQSGLAAVLKQVKENGIPDAVSRASVKRARTQSVRLTTTAGPIFKSWSIPKVGTDKMLVLEYIDPISWLTHIAEHCAGFASFMERCLAQKPSTLEAPWQIALYCDEVTPGNQMRHDNKRKVQAVYWSFLQYGSTSLSCETKWMVLTAARSKLITDIGGMSVFLLTSWRRSLVMVASLLESRFDARIILTSFALSLVWL